MSPNALVKVGEMLLREALQNHMVASQGFDSGEACRTGVGNDCCKSKWVLRHAGHLRGRLRCSGSKYDDGSRERMRSKYTVILIGERITIYFVNESFPEVEKNRNPRCERRRVEVE
jgi:hypothetical protein